MLVWRDDVRCHATGPGDANRAEMLTQVNIATTARRALMIGNIWVDGHSVAHSNRFDLVADRDHRTCDLVAQDVGIGCGVRAVCNVPVGSAETA